MIITDEIRDLFKLARTKLGAPIRTVQLDDEQMCSLLESSVGDYAEKAQEYVTEMNWINLMGKNANMSASELTFALSTRTLDFTRDIGEWYSKEVGLQQRGTKWELKKDYVTVEPGKQCYIIPAGREINRIMWITPSTTKAAMIMQNGGFGPAMDGGLGYGSQLGGAAGFNGLIGCFGSAFDTALYSVDLKYKNQFFRSDLVYKVTAGPNGTHILHLLSVPGMKNPVTFGNMAVDDKGWSGLKDCYVWYDYYDVSPNEEDECLIDNSNTVLITPDQLKLGKMHYNLLNYATQQTVKNLFIAECFITLGIIRGTFSGKLSIMDAEAAMDYGMLLEYGKTEKQKTFEALKDRFNALKLSATSEEQMKYSQNVLETLKTKPIVGFYIK